MHPRRLIQRHFLEGLGPGESERLRAHLRQCGRCRDEYDHLALTLRAASGREQSRAEVDRLREAVMSSVQLAPSPRPPLSRPLRPPGGAYLSLWPTRLVPALSAGLLAGVAALLLVYRPHLREPEVSWKGGAAAAVADLQVVGIAESQDGPARPRLVEEGGPLYLDELMQFRYLSSDPRHRYLYLFGLDESFQVIDYFPRPQASQSIEIRPALAMEPIARSIRLAKRHAAGQLWVFALFSVQPLERQQVHDTVARHRIRGVRPELLGRIDWGRDVLPVVRRFQVKNQDR